jgi:hypothetical protein
MKIQDKERPVFGPATALFVGRSPLWGCSLLTPCGMPKSLAAPFALIYEMASRPFHFFETSGVSIPSY